jgi:hypothetical protein
LRNEPAEGIRSTRFEVASPKGALERRFLHAIVAAGAGETAPTPVRIEGNGADGVAIDDEAYIFPTSGPGAASLSYRAPATATLHIVTGLVPNARYTTIVTREAREGAGCRVSLSAGAGSAASAAGVLALGVNGCVLGK